MYAFIVAKSKLPIPTYCITLCKTITEILNNTIEENILIHRFICDFTIKYIPILVINMRAICGRMRNTKIMEKVIQKILFFIIAQRESTKKKNIVESFPRLASQK